MEDVFECIIEIPMGTKNKYEVNKKTGKIKLDRVLYSSVVYPGEYGYITDTLSSDNDPLDILIISSEPTFPGCYVDARVLGYLDDIDNGDNDEKIIAVVDKDPRFNEYKTLKDIPEHILDEIKEFFSTYKKLQKITVEINDFHTKEEALELIKKCKENYKANIK